MSDEYESKFMGADQALFFERQIARRMLALPFFGALSGIAAITASVLQGGLVATSLFAAAAVGLGAVLYLGFLGVFFGVARTAVTKDELRVEIGMLGPRLAMASIKKVEAIPFTRRGRLFERSFVPPTSTECVRVTYDDHGTERTVVIGTQRATALVEAVERAKGGAASLPRVRVEAPADPDVVAAEAEVEAELARQDDERAKAEAKAE
ncbi:MAG: hypothetical protein U0353_34850 [Sandaracinus sp.]